MVYTTETKLFDRNKTQFKEPKDKASNKLNVEVIQSTSQTKEPQSDKPVVT